MLLMQTRRTASWLCEKMSGEGHAVALLSGELNVEDRASVIDRFREGKEKVLITTNVTARGKTQPTCSAVKPVSIFLFVLEMETA